MDIYVNTAGFTIDQDYVWLDKNNKIVNIPEEFKFLKSLIDTESPSIIFAKNHYNFFMSVTGIKSNRVDYRNRIILNSIVWISDKAEDCDTEKYWRAGLIFILESFIEKNLNDFLQQDIDSIIIPKDNTEDNTSKNFEDIFSFKEICNKNTKAKEIYENIGKNTKPSNNNSELSQDKFELKQIIDDLYNKQDLFTFKIQQKNKIFSENQFTNFVNKFRKLLNNIKWKPLLVYSREKILPQNEMEKILISSLPFFPKSISNYSNKNKSSKSKSNNNIDGI